MNERAMPMEPAIDAELKTLAIIEQQLREFDYTTQMRMLQFIHARLKGAQPKASP